MLNQSGERGVCCSVPVCGEGGRVGQRKDQHQRRCHCPGPPSGCLRLTYHCTSCSWVAEERSQVCYRLRLHWRRTGHCSIAGESVMLLELTGIYFLRIALCVIVDYCNSLILESDLLNCSMELDYWIVSRVSYSQRRYDKCGAAQQSDNVVRGRIISV